MCIASEYPETEAGTLFAIKRCEELEEALHRRFPEKLQRAS
jgi:hypothetical protein